MPRVIWMCFWTSCPAAEEWVADVLRVMALSCGSGWCVPPRAACKTVAIAVSGTAVGVVLRALRGGGGAALWGKEKMNRNSSNGTWNVIPRSFIFFSCSRTPFLDFWQFVTLNRADQWSRGHAEWKKNRWLQVWSALFKSLLLKKKPDMSIFPVISWKLVSYYPSSTVLRSVQLLNISSSWTTRSNENKSLFCCQGYLIL